MTTRVRCWHGGWARRLPDHDPAAGPALVLRPRPDTALAWPTHMGCRGRCCSCGRSKPYFSHSVRQVGSPGPGPVQDSESLPLPVTHLQAVRLRPAPGGQVQDTAASCPGGLSPRLGALAAARVGGSRLVSGSWPGPNRARGARAAGASVRRVAARIGLGWSGLRVRPAAAAGAVVSARRMTAARRKAIRCGRDHLRGPVAAGTVGRHRDAATGGNASRAGLRALSLGNHAAPAAAEQRRIAAHSF
jgi:hypothetical protein